MKVDDLMDWRKAGELLEDGYLRERAHPDHPELRVIGYTEKAQWERVWVHETRTCRGLIYRADTLEVVARPWPKFFNLGEHENGSGLGDEDNTPLEMPDMGTSVEVTDKMDGSLGIIYENPFTGRLAVATRGSFDSDQARLANAEFLPRILEGVPDVGADPWRPLPGWTYLTEIIDPTNRIVLDYGAYRGLALLGAVNIETGWVRGPTFDPTWPDRVAEVFDCESLTDALALEPRPNAEGVVVRYHGTGVMVKIKQEDYVRLHKIVTGLSDIGVWEHLKEHGNSAALIEAVPDEWHPWLEGVLEDFNRRHNQILLATREEYEDVTAAVEAQGVDPEDPGYRKAFALLAKEKERPHLLFARLTGKPLAPMIWKELRPVGARYMTAGAGADE